MGTINLKNGKYNVLSIINNLLKNMGTSKNLLSKEICDDIESNIDSMDEQKVADSILIQLEEINEQIENMSWLNKHYKILHDFAQICSKTLNEDILLNKAYEMVSQVMPTDAFYIALYTEGDSHIHFVFMIEHGEIYPEEYVEFGDNYSSKVIQTREIFHQKKAVQNVVHNESATFGVNDTSSCIFVPVIIDDCVKGVISAQSYSDFAYRKEHEELLQIIGTQVINSIETARLYEKIYTMSLTDEMTGLKNHRAFHEDISKWIKEKNQELTLVMIDSDNLKKVNDSYGHDHGDKYLQVLADGIKSICDENMEGYRYAGDEFMLIIKSPTENKMEQLYERLMDYYTRNPIYISTDQINVSISAGVAHYPKHGNSVDSLKKIVDEALYVAKKQGGNRLVMAEKHRHFLYLSKDEMYFI